MATKRPLVRDQVTGQIAEMAQGDTLPSDTYVGGGGIVGTATVDIDFGSFEDSLASATITGLGWVTPSMKFIKNAVSSADHTVEETALENVSVEVTNIVDGVGFDVYASAPHGTSGIHRFEIAGI